MTNSMKQTVIKNPTWWKRRSALERCLIIIAVCGVLTAIALAVALGVVSSKPACSTENALFKTEMLPSSAEALDDKNQRTKIKVVNSTAGSESVCLRPGCIHAASRILETVDPQVEPCDDFFKFACGTFLKKTVIPDDKTAVTTFNVIGDKLHEKLRISIEEEIKPNELRSFRLAKILYRSCMNTTAIEAKGLTPIIETLKKLGGWPVLEGDAWREEEFEWKQSVYKFRKAGYSIDYFFDTSIGIDLKNSTKRVLNIDQATLGLNREYLIEGFSDKIVSAYYRYMVDVAVTLGADEVKAEKELKESLEFEMKLANISSPIEERRNGTILYNPMSIKKLAQKYSSIPWKEYFNTILKPNVKVDEKEIVIVNEPSFFVEFEKVMAQTPKRVQANYVMWRAVAAAVSFLSEDIRKQQLKYSTAVSGRAERGARWKECVDVTCSSLGISVSALYVRKYSDEGAKKSASEMVLNIQNEFEKILKTIDWMDEKTRRSALVKAKSMANHIGYPPELLTDKKVEEYYAKLEITEGDYFQSIVNSTLFGTNYSFSKLLKPVNTTDWVSHSSSVEVNAFYSSIENSIQIPAGILQGPFFDEDRPKYMNYGAIGFVIGHEITHAFDDQGRQFDENGNLLDWWEPGTREKYLSKAKCIIHQYGNYTAEEVGKNLNGINTQGENIADNGGIKESYLAYQNWVKKNGPEPKLPGLDYSPSQLFWISAAHIWCSKYRPEALRIRLTTGVHSPGQFRVLGAFSNMPYFAKDFKCPMGSKMNPSKKCTVW